MRANAHKNVRRARMSGTAHLAIRRSGRIQSISMPN